LKDGYYMWTYKSVQTMTIDFVTVGATTGRDLNKMLLLLL